jgi:hypothetical protein
MVLLAVGVVLELITFPLAAREPENGVTPPLPHWAVVAEWTGVVCLTLGAVAGITAWVFARRARRATT